MKNNKILAIIIISIIFFINYRLYRYNNSNNNFEDKLSIFILVKANKNINDIFLYLEKQIETFDDYIKNVYFSRDNNYLIENKLKLQFDKDNIDYRELYDSKNIADFNIRLANMLENSFLDFNFATHKTNRYLLRDFLTRFYKYINYQIEIYNENNSTLDSMTMIQDFIIGEKFNVDFKKEYYLVTIEFYDQEAMSAYKTNGIDSIFNFILDHSSKTFDTDLCLYNPQDMKNSSSEIDNKILQHQLKQYIIKSSNINEAIGIHKDLMLTDNIVLIESLYDYYFEGNDYEVDFMLSDTIINLTYDEYKESLLLIEERLVELQVDQLYNDHVITNILFDLVGDGDVKGFYSNYIDSLDVNAMYKVSNINRLFTYELRSLFNRIDYTKTFDFNTLPKEVKTHLFNNEFYNIRYFTK